MDPAEGGVPLPSRGAWAQLGVRAGGVRAGRRLPTGVELFRGWKEWLWLGRMRPCEEQQHC